MACLLVGLAVAMISMAVMIGVTFVVTMTLMAAVTLLGLTRHIDRDLDGDFTGALEHKRDVDGIAVLQLAGQPHEHHMVAATFQLMGLA